MKMGGGKRGRRERGKEGKRQIRLYLVSHNCACIFFISLFTRQKKKIREIKKKLFRLKATSLSLYRVLFTDSIDKKLAYCQDGETHSRYFLFVVSI